MYYITVEGISVNGNVIPVYINALMAARKLSCTTFKQVEMRMSADDSIAARFRRGVRMAD